MQCGVKRKHCPSLEHINLERQQQSLFDLSILKLQQEQLRHGVEPRLLRFVLINNALRALQGHMFIFGDDDEFSFDSASTSSNRCGGGAGGEGTTESFLSNTFRDGGLPTTPASPPTPVKVTKMESTLSDQSPLVSSTPFQSFVAESGCTTSSEDVERDGVRSAMVATPPPGLTPPTPAEAMEGVAATCSSGDGKAEGGELERRIVGEVLPVTMTTVEERPDDFSTTIVDSPCTCGNRVSLGKRSREQNSSSSDDHPCQCSMDHIGDNNRTESPCICEDKGDSIIEGDCASPSKKLCSRPPALSLNGTKRLNGSVNGLNGLNSVYTVLGLDQIPTSSSNNSTSPSSPSTDVPSPCSPSSSSPQSAAHSPCPSEEPDEDSSTPSPIDFTKVDPTLYDYDTRAPLFIPTQDPPPPTSPPPPPPAADTDDSVCHHNGDHHISNGCSGGGSVPSTTSPDSSSTPPSSSSLPPSCSSASISSSSNSAVIPPLAPPTADEAPCCSASDSMVTSPTLAITATSTTFSLPPPSSEYPLISSSSTLSESCSPSSIVDSNLIDCPSDGKHSSSSPSSCSLEGLVSAQNGKLHHNHSKSERTDSESGISNGLKGGVPSSPEGAENDFLEDIEHIVSLLMT